MKTQCVFQRSLIPGGYGYHSKSPNIRALPFFSLMPSMLNNAEPSQTMQNLNHFHYFSDGWRVINWGIIAEIFLTG